MGDLRQGTYRKHPVLSQTQPLSRTAQLRLNKTRWRAERKKHDNYMTVYDILHTTYYVPHTIAILY